MTATRTYEPNTQVRITHCNRSVHPSVRLSVCPSVSSGLLIQERKVEIWQT